MDKYAERRKAIAADYESGMTLKELGLKYGISTERARQICQKQGAVKPESRFAKLRRERIERKAALEDRRAQIVYAYLVEKKKLKDIASEFRLLDTSAVSNSLRRWGVPPRGYVRRLK